jgi:hypothetical protein
MWIIHTERGGGEEVINVSLNYGSKEIANYGLRKQLLIIGQIILFKPKISPLAEVFFCLVYLDSFYYTFRKYVIISFTVCNTNFLECFQKSVAHEVL